MANVCFVRDTDGRQMAVGGFLNILNDQLTDISSGENDGQAIVTSESVAFEILGKKKQREIKKKRPSF